MDELDALRRMRTALAEEEPPDALAARIDWRSVPVDGSVDGSAARGTRTLRRRLRLPDRKSVV